jgi:DNA-binding CsgD family transcriptional regulator
VNPSVDWSVVAADSGAGVLVLDTQGRILFINAPAAKVFAKRPAGEVTGLRITDILPPVAANERLDIARHVIQTGEALLVHDLWSGVALRATVRRLSGFAESAGPAAIFVLTHEGALLEESPDASGPKLRAVETRHVDMGALSGLTQSELRVMALIGEGLSNAEIAARLHRAVKTVESHRAALTDKTGSTSRVQLGILARRAGLARRVGVEAPAAAPGAPAPTQRVMA